MTKFAFTRRVTVETPVWYEAETEHEAWQKALSGANVDKCGNDKLTRLPTFRRDIKQDEFDL